MQDWAEVHCLHRNGVPKRVIARRLGMSHTIVHRHPCASRLQVGPRVDDHEVVRLFVHPGTGGKRKELPVVVLAAGVG